MCCNKITYRILYFRQIAHSPYTMCKKTNGLFGLDRIQENE